jgi:gliding motility-associated-like protein
MKNSVSKFNTILLVICFTILTNKSYSQIALINSIDSLYILDQSSCNYVNAGAYCEQINGQIIYSIALRKDTLYFLGRQSQLYRMKLGVLSSCTQLTTFPVNGPFGSSINSMTVDKNGIIYAADMMSRELWRYNPYTNVKNNLGILNVQSGGDMIFYKDKLLLATLQNGIYEVNASTPGNSTLYMATPGYTFYGLLSRPFDCSRNKYYGLAFNGQITEMIELDLEAKQIIGTSCQIPLNVYDAASNVDDGNTIGVNIDSLFIQPACWNSTIASLQVFASSATAGGLTYILDGTTTNTSGIFNNINEGNHQLLITNQGGCSKDSLFFIPHGLSPVISIQKSMPYSCDQPDGSITVAGSSGFPPVMYSLDGSTFQTSSIFNNLAGGIHNIIIKDAKGCQKDTTALLSYQNRPNFFTDFSITPTICDKKSGTITINLATGTDPTQVYCSLNGGTPQQVVTFGNLDAGTYSFSALYQNSCNYDTIIQINKLVDAAPIVEITTTNQKCLVNNGSARIRVTGPDNPYLINFNHTIFSSISDFNNLAPGIYSVEIRNNNTCEVAGIVEIKPYELLPFTVVTNKTDPTCKKLNGGEIKVSITGIQSPYQFRINNTAYQSGVNAGNLSKGVYNISIMNNDNCEIDTLIMTLNLEVTSDCNYVYVPSAFTPNGDGLNDIFRAFVGEAVTDFNLLIYNRGGQLVFFGNDKNKGWDGKINGVIQPSQVYVWMIRYKILGDVNERLLKGTITLVR